MSTLSKHPRSRLFGTGHPANALAYAHNVFAAVDRRMPEARALGAWLTENATAFGLSDDAVPDDCDGFRHARRRPLSMQDWQKIGDALEATLSIPMTVANNSLADWLGALSRMLQLDAVSARILALALHYQFDKRVENLFDMLSECRGGDRRLSRDADLMALLLGMPSCEIAASLMPAGPLLGSGLVQLDRFGRLQVQDRLVSLIRRNIPPEADLLDQLLGPVRSSSLAWDAFAHLGRQADIASAVLRAALAGSETGIGILLYGPPGTGKTSFAATLAAHIGASLRPVAEADDDGDEPTRGDRLAGLRLAQRLVPPGGSVLLFDEAEDLFTQRGTRDDEPVTHSRVFIHRLLEQLAVPVIWTANDIGALGPAVLRRMTMCVEMKVPNLATRTMLWRRMGEAEGIALQDAEAGRLARLIPAAPAIASGAMRAARLAGGGEETARIVVEGVARAVRGGDLPAPAAAPDALYDPALVNADCDLAALAADLLRPDATRAVSFLLSGPPGAGKSAWVRHLADRMGMPVLHKRASDLLDMFVGGTEQNIAGAFAEAREAQAFLVFDEADSLLLERADAVRSWEISQVNEMLTWMEAHALPFACTTNLADRLDRVSLRRFLVKLRFDWLTAAQARLAFSRFFGTPAPAGLDALRTLTPADFSLVRRRAAVRGGQADPEVLLRLLADECRGRVGAKLPVTVTERAVPRKSAQLPIDARVLSAGHLAQAPGSSLLRNAIICCFCLLAPVCAHAVDECASLKTLDQIYDAFKDGKDWLTYHRAIRCGLRNDDKLAQNLAIFHMFSAGGLPGEAGPGAHLNLVVENDPGDEAAAELLVKMPIFSIGKIRWTEDGQQFAGGPAAGYYGASVTGNFTGLSLTVNFYGWPLPDSNNRQSPNAAFATNCWSEIKPNLDRTQLEGSLHCKDFDHHFKLKIGI